MKRRTTTRKTTMPTSSAVSFLVVFLSCSIVIGSLIGLSESFTTTSSNIVRRRKTTTIKTPSTIRTTKSSLSLSTFSFKRRQCMSTTRLHSDYNGGGGDGMDNLRRDLESSWDVEAMGQVPTTATSAAEEASLSILAATKDGLGNMYFIDLFLPQYDIAQGENTYDEIDAVEYCVFLSQYLLQQQEEDDASSSGKAVVYVKDQISLRRTTRVLDNREMKQLREEIRQKKKEEEEEYDDEDMYEYDNVSMIIDEDDPEWDQYPDDTIMEDKSSSSDFYDDFAETNSNDSFYTAAKKEEEDPSFRNELYSAWKDDDGDDDKQQSSSNASNEPLQPQKKKQKKITKRIKRKISNYFEDDEELLVRRKFQRRAKERNYRIASLFGDSQISNGGEMTNDVIKALKKHGLPKKDEDTLILLSLNTDADMLAIRALISKYRNTKKHIILVNCRLDPLPLELDSCSTVYHLTPMVAAPAQPDPSNIFDDYERERNEKLSSPRDEKAPPIKVVSIRRYPRDWEVYVDADGNGFELAQKTPAFKFPKKGPGMEWIATAVKNFFQDGTIP